MFVPLFEQALFKKKKKMKNKIKKTFMNTH